VSGDFVSAAQLRAGRHLADLSQYDIAAATGLSLPTIKRAESEREVSVSEDALDAIRAALEAAGVIFIEADGQGAGVRIRRHSDYAPAPSPPGKWTLEDHADFINRRFNDEAVGERASFRAQRKAGNVLIEARKLVPPGEWGDGATGK
jgi:transcriptional regulator with XRE-family HTH domain